MQLIDDVKKKLGFSDDIELANYLKKHKSTVSKWRVSGEIPAKAEKELIKILHDGCQETFGFQPKIKLIPVFTSVPAGWPCEGYVAEEPLAYIPFESNGRNMGALLVDGHSMSPDIKDGEYVVYVEDYDFKPGDRLVVTNEFGKSMVKEYAIKDGEPWLISVNPEYGNHKVNEGFKLIGRVIEVYSKRKVGRR